jgi:hypothetical protein
VDTPGPRPVYDPAADPVHGSGWNSAARWGGWHWGEPSRGEHFRRCSFCGSISPDDLAAEPGWHASWADQKYGWLHKFYVNIPNRNPDALFVVSGRSDAREGLYARGGEKWTPPEPGLIAWADLTPEQLAIAERDGLEADRLRQLRHPAVPLRQVLQRPPRRPGYQPGREGHHPAAQRSPVHLA